MKRWQRERIRKALKIVRTGSLFRLRFAFEWELMESDVEPHALLDLLGHIQRTVAAHLETKTDEVRRIINAKTEREVSEDKDDL